uniref:Reverse transcriptase domain-containing protein n=1 Tax=Salmo trutta TaxID=8032 RepID=A0A673ZSF1_SALTR
SLINSSLTAGYVPSVFKRARVAPLLKKPTLDPSHVNNYRPVSLLSFLSKTLERAILGQLSCYLSQNDLLDPNQSGFKTGHSTETALLCVTEALRTAKANSLSSALILLDLSAAFDTVNHQILLSTLSELGISGAAHAWIASYLTGRSYQVAWRESVSAPRALTTGVPQGSVLGPLLFSLYTKSLGSVISSHGLSYHCYADDTQLIFSFPPSDNQAANRISACLADVSVWMTDHHLKLNLGKTELLFLPGKDCPFHDLAITVDNSLVSSPQSAKNLGVILDNTLSFSTNIKAVTRSCRFMLYNIRRVRPCLTQEATQVLIQALVISRLDYCNSLLAGLPACAIKPLQLIQNAAVRLVFNLPKFSHVTPLLRSLHWLPVEARIRYKTMVLAYGAVRGTAPPYLQALIRPYTQTRALRSSTSGLLAPYL